MQGAVQDEPRPDPLADVDRAEVVLAATRAEEQVAQGLGPRLQVDGRRDAGAVLDPGAERQAVQAGGQLDPDDHPGLGVDHAADGHPDAAHR